MSEEKTSHKLTLLKIGVSSCALFIVVIQIAWKDIKIDAITLGLFVIILLPWLSELFESIEVPGGWKFAFKKIEDKQKRQGADLGWVKSVATLLISDYEKNHLEYLQKNEPFLTEVEQGSNFEWELRHLIALNFIQRHPGKGLRQIFGVKNVNLKDLFFVTDRGKEYLRLVKESNEL